MAELVAPRTLLAAYTPGDPTGVTDAHPGPEPREVVTVAADRARRFLAGLQTLSDESIQLIHEDVQELAGAYQKRPLTEILGHLVSAQDTVFGLLERPQRPTHIRQLHFLSAVLGGILGKASEDLVDRPAALAQLRTAWLCRAGRPRRRAGLDLRPSVGGLIPCPSTA